MSIQNREDELESTCREIGIGRDDVVLYKGQPRIVRTNYEMLEPDEVCLVELAYTQQGIVLNAHELLTDYHNDRLKPATVTARDESG